MARLSATSLLLLLAAGACGQGFGRFGYSESVTVPGFQLNKDGFKVNHPSADVFRFRTPSKTWNPVLTDSFGQTVLLSGSAGSPSKLRVDLTAPGFSLHFRHGFSLKLTSTGSPYLTWPEGSTEPNVDALPPAKWVAISFRDNQPPLILGFPTRSTAVRLVGRPGEWELKSDGPFEGWVRIAAPLGTSAQATTSAAELGQLSQAIKKNEDLWTSDAPRLVSRQVVADETSVTATWTFDSPRVMLPFALFFAPIGGYAVKVQSPTVDQGLRTEEGPIVLTADKVLKVRFVLRRIPNGRALTVGLPTEEEASTVSAFDVPGVVELALANLLASRDNHTRKLAEDVLAEFVKGAAYAAEPATAQQLPYAASGQGMDLCAAHALLMESSLANSPTSSANSLLTSLTWRRDWLTWKLWSPDPLLSRRAAAVGAVAAALCAEPERRLEAAMLQAGLAAERGKAVWERRRGISAQDAKFIEPLEDLRADLFFMRLPPEPRGFMKALMSEVRAFGAAPMTLVPREGKLYLRWMAEDLNPFEHILASAYPLDLKNAESNASFEATDAFGFTVIRGTPVNIGLFEILLKTPEWAEPLPAWQPPPRYSEPLR